MAAAVASVRADHGGLAVVGYDGESIYCDAVDEGEMVQSHSAFVSFSPLTSSLRSFQLTRA